MENRVDVSLVDPDGYGAVLELERHVRGRVDPTTYELVKLRASMLNGCAFCVDMHTTAALEHGEDPRRIAAISAWHEAPFYDRRERAVLALTDAATRLGEGGVPDAVWEEAVEQLGTDGAVDVLFAIATINVWNRIAITSRMQPPALADRVAVG
jgi:AhpD family alkylhydroperoxidase